MVGEHIAETFAGVLHSVMLVFLVVAIFGSTWHAVKLLRST